MKERCYNHKNHAWKTYGGRGIDICDEWREDVFAFRDWALSHGYADNLSIDRIDNDKYSPDNCRWLMQRRKQTINIRNIHLPQDQPKSGAGNGNWNGRLMEKRSRPLIGASNTD